MTTYIPASNAVKNDYSQLKQHLLAYINKLTNFQDYYVDVCTMCRMHKMDDEIKSAIIDMLILHKNFNKQLCDQLGENFVPSDEQIDNMGSFESNIWRTWPYFTPTAVRYINRYCPAQFELFIEINISNIQWDYQCLNYVCEQVIKIELIKQILDTSGLSLTSSTLIIAYGTHNIPLIKLHNMPITTDCVLAAAERTYKANDFVVNLVKQLPLTIDTFTLMIQIKQCTPHTFNNILQHVHPTQEHIKLACIHHRIDLIQILLNYRLSVDAECFELMFFTGSLNGNKNTIVDGIEHFIRAGYQLTYEDVVRLARRKLYVHDIKRFNFTFDDEIINIFILNNYYPYGHDLPYTVKSLQLECQKPSSTYERISQIIDSGVIPDKQCIFNIFVRNSKSISGPSGHDRKIILLLLEHITVPIIDAELTHLLINYGFQKNTTTKY